MSVAGGTESRAAPSARGPQTTVAGQTITSGCRRLCVVESRQWNATDTRARASQPRSSPRLSMMYAQAPFCSVAFASARFLVAMGTSSAKPYARPSSAPAGSPSAKTGGETLPRS